jgi:hypothetical protein
MKAVTVLVTAALLAASVAASAQATVREKLRSKYEWSFAEDCGFPVEVTGRGKEQIIIREGKNGDAGAFPFAMRFSYTETWTNPATGAWFLIRGHLHVNEVEATRVEGSVFLFRFVEAGQPFVVEDSDGNVVARDNGSVQGTYLFDTEGDDQPGGTWIAGLDRRVNGPHPSLDRDSCDYAAELIG